jgi:hypothetical protein
MEMKPRTDSQHLGNSVSNPFCKRLQLSTNNSSFWAQFGYAVTWDLGISPNCIFH